MRKDRRRSPGITSRPRGGGLCHGPSGGRTTAVAPPPSTPRLCKAGYPGSRPGMQDRCHGTPEGGTNLAQIPQVVASVRAQGIESFESGTSQSSCTSVARLPAGITGPVVTVADRDAMSRIMAQRSAGRLDEAAVPRERSLGHREVSNRTSTFCLPPGHPAISPGRPTRVVLIFPPCRSTRNNRGKVQLTKPHNIR